MIVAGDSLIDHAHRQQALFRKDQLEQSDMQIHLIISILLGVESAINQEIKNN